jgi:uncharacterized protein (TIGR03790 family)
MVWKVLVLFLLASPLWAIGPENVLIVANEKVEGSVEIAEYYAKRRRIDVNQILKISASDKEEITREEFTRDIWEPVQRSVKASSKICVIVPTRGVPLKVKDRSREDNDGAFKGHDEASVDGELTLARQDALSIDGAVRNDLLDSIERITPNSKYLVVCRLDGPTVEIVKGMIDKAILAETLGAVGRSFLDTRGDKLGQGYLERDRQMRLVAGAWGKVALPFDHDSLPEVTDLSTRPETLHYYGWYAGTQVPAAPVQFRTGGICVHLHSFSASTIRAPDKNWVGPLLSWGATASYGTVYEPYTAGFPYEHVFWDRLCNGWTFGEAGLVANGLLSWQAVFCGDPLYTPYAKGREIVNKRYRIVVAHVLAPKEGAEAPDSTRLLLLDNVIDILKTRQENLAALISAESEPALAELNSIRFLVHGMELEAWITKLADPFQAALKVNFENMKRAIKADITQTTGFERALAEWTDLPIYAEVLEFRDELAKDQERAAAKLLKRAQSDLKASRWLRAWVGAAEVAAHRFAPDAAKEGTAILDEIKADKDVMTALKGDADKALEPVVERAGKEMERGRADRAAKHLGTEWRWFPDCEQRTAAEALALRIAQTLAGEG